MKHEIWLKPTLINFISCLTIYLCFAFSEWEINPGAWSEVNRAIASILIGIFSFITLVRYLQLLAYEYK